MSFTCKGKKITKKIGRNDPCPCGSGKKYKKCCMRSRSSFSVSLKSQPSIIDYHWVSNDRGKTWRKEPGILAARIHMTDSEELAQEVELLFKEVSSSLKKTQNLASIQEKLHICRHKLYAVKYALENLRREEQSQVKKYEEGFTPPSGVQQVVDNPRLIYEVEAFLFQSKSSLDVLARVLNPIFGFRLHTFGRKGEGVIRVLENNCPGRRKARCRKLVNLIQREENWIEELVEMRDQITHYSNLKGFQCFVEEPYVGGKKSIIHYPTMPSGKRATEYCNFVWERLLSFHRKFLKIALVR